MQSRLGPGAPHVKKHPPRAVPGARLAAAAVVAVISAAALSVSTPAVADPPPDEIIAIRISGNSIVPEERIRDAMKLRTAAFLRGAPYEPELLEDDLTAVRALYMSRGFLDAQVSGRAEVVNARTLPHQVAIEITIVEGVRTMVTATLFEGNTVFPSDMLLKVVSLKPPAPYDSLELEPDIYRIQTLYLDEGYLQMRVEPVITGGPGTRALLYRIREGRQYRVGSIHVEGNVRTREWVIRRELTVAPGDIFRRRLMISSEQNVYDTGLFSRVDLIPGPPVGREEALDLTIRVTERDARWLGAGIGYGTLDELRLSGEWGNRNVAGTARRLDVRTLFATEVFPFRTQRVRLEAGFGEPNFAGPASLLSVNPFFERRMEDFIISSALVGRYQLQSVGVSATLRRDFEKRSQLWFGVNQSWLQMREPTFEPDEEALVLLGFDESHHAQEASFTAGYERDTRNDFLNPRRGSLSRIQGKLAAARPLGFNKPFAKFGVTGGRHRPFGKEGVFSTRLTLGAIVIVGRDAPVPDRERFKIGGESTLRGYADRVIGPGNIMFAGSLEWLFPLPGNPRGFVFTDGGGVWGRLEDVHLEQLFNFDGQGAVRYTTGTGVWIPTPMGPLKLGYGQRIGQHPVASSGRFFVVFGQAL